MGGVALGVREREQGGQKGHGIGLGEAIVAERVSGVSPAWLQANLLAQTAAGAAGGR